MEVGQLVVLSNEAFNDNYEDAPWRGKVMKITHKATKYMPSTRFFTQGMPQGYSPGYDEGVSPTPLFDLECVDGTPMGSSLYRWELRPATVAEARSGYRA
jgi:hypothetical protein